MGHESERELEENLIKKLISEGYDRVKINDEDDLNKNLREQLNKFNRKKLKDIPLSDKEFERILKYLEGKSVYESSKLFRDKFVLERENGDEVYIEFFNQEDYLKNNFQVTNQVTMVNKYINRYDVTILINGLPLVQIELKRRGLDLKEAFNQIERYRKHSYKGLYRYIQCFVISNGVDTKYFSNSDKGINFNFTFFWSDEKNNRISNLYDFADTFLEKSNLNKIISKYMIIKNAEKDKDLMIMRPYQIYAVEALIKQARETNNNGYIWHTTGSGKTLTSFKASQILANEESVKKVFFLIDRKDLDTQTVEEFNVFEKDSVDTTNNVDVLLKQIEDINKGLIVTTIQKLSRLLASPKYSKTMDKYRNEKVIFIIDECHRSQFGEMHTAITKHFKNSQYFGFTGTPRLKENKSQDGRTTADIFHKCLHTYLIKDAINDNNVLGFSVEYIKTFYGDVDEYDDIKIKAIDKEEVYMADERINMVANHIIKIHNNKSVNRKYSALFAVSSIDMLVKYYDAFKNIDHDLKIGAIFTFQSNEDFEKKTEHSRDSLERIIKDYNVMFPQDDIEKEYSTDTFQAYFKDLCKKIKSAEIDIVIVVNMLLTGFDSKLLNTLYVDKNLKYHGLVQAYSRTNRVYDITKPYGNIVCYRNLKKETDDAICLFSQTDSTDVVLMKEYSYYLDIFKRELAKLKSIASTVESVDEIKDEDTKKVFVETFRDLSKQLVRLKTFTEFNFDENELGISEQEYEDYKSKYFNIYDSVKRGETPKTSILYDIDFGIELMHTDKINVSYIMDLIRNIDFNDKSKVKADIEKIKKLLQNADNENLRLKSDLIREFLDKATIKISGNESIDSIFDDFIEEKKSEEINNFSNEVEFKEQEIKDYIDEYEYSGLIDTSSIKDLIKGGLLKKKKISEKIKKFIIEHVNKFSF